LRWQWVRNRQICHQKFRREYPLAPYTADFCRAELKLFLKIDGGEHFTEAGKERDQTRDEYLNRARSQPPWYDSKGLTSQTGPDGAVGVFMPQGDVANLPGNGQFILATGDTPFLATYSGPMINPVTGALLEANNRLRIDFVILVGAQTIDGTHGAREARNIYTERARAEWHFQGHGTFNRMTGAWVGDEGNEVAGDAEFTPLENGRRINIPAKPRAFNDIINRRR
jgi:hypothetical protein